MDSNHTFPLNASICLAKLGGNGFIHDMDLPGMVYVCAEAPLAVLESLGSTCLERLRI